MILSVTITLWGAKAILTTGIASATFAITGATPFELYILSNISNIGLLLVVSTCFFFNFFFTSTGCLQIGTKITTGVSWAAFRSL